MKKPWTVTRKAVEECSACAITDENARKNVARPYGFDGENEEAAQGQGREHKAILKLC